VEITLLVLSLDNKRIVEWGLELKFLVHIGLLDINCSLKDLKNYCVMTVIYDSKCTSVQGNGMIVVTIARIRQVAVLQLHNMGVLYSRYLGIFVLAVIGR